MKTLNFVAAALLLGCCVSVSSPLSAVEPPAVKPEQAVDAANERSEDSSSDEALSDIDDGAANDLKPRFQVHVPSLQEFVENAERSAAGKIARHIQSMTSEFADENGNGVDREVLAAVWRSFRGWPETSLDLAVFAADREGLARWAVRVDIPIGQLHDLLMDLVGTDGNDSFFDGSTLRVVDGGFVAEVGGQPVAHLTACGTDRTVIASHRELALPDEFFSGIDGDGPVLLAAQLDWTETEKDSGATLFSKFNVVTTIDYTIRADNDGNWVDDLRVNWPPVAGMTLKALLGRTRQSFFVPDEAFMAVSFNAIAAQALLDASVGLVDGDDSDKGVIQLHGGSDVCTAMLPGRGFFPIPDLVTQCRVSDREEFEDSMAARIKQLNRKARKKDRRPPWKTAKVRGHTVFWNQGSLQTNGMILPASMRAVLFVQTAKDAKERERNFLIVAATSTDPVEFVDYWLDLPRRDSPRFLPLESRSNSEVWVHWQQVFDHLEPYANLSLVSLSTDAVLPAELGEDIPHGHAVARLKYEGLRVSHRGPVPLGIVALPSMFSTSLQKSTGTDLARERLASRRLKVLYHHSQLFRQDTGRWPVEVAELDGYVDFAGHPELLKLKTSPRKRWSDWLENMFDSDDDDEDSEDENDNGLYADIDDSLYVVAWRDDMWTLGIAPDTLDHLDQLYIDQDGRLHRVAVVSESNTADTDDTEVSAAEDTGDSPAAASP